MNSAATSRSGGLPSARALSIIAPCLNEEHNIDPLVDRTLRTFDLNHLAGELLLIDDGSRDDTWPRIQARAASEVRVRGYRHPSNRGIAAAWRTGLAAASAETVCLIDADLQNQPEDIVRLFQTYREHRPDLVQGVRHPQPGVRRGRMFSRGLNLLLNFVFRTNQRDSKSGFILCSREVLRDLLAHRFCYRYFQSFIGVAAASRAYRIVEVDTPFHQRHAGASFLPRFPLRVSLRILWELLKYRVETWAPHPQLSRSVNADWPLPSVVLEPGGVES